MPAGYSARCKVCNSPHRAEVERWRGEGLSYQAIADRLADLGECVSYESVRRHLANHFNVKAEARRQYEKSKAAMREQVDRTLSEVEMLDGVARRSYKLLEATSAWLDELLDPARGGRQEPPRELVRLHAALAAEVRQHLLAKASVLGEDGMGRLADAVALTLEELQERYRERHGDAQRGEEEADA